MNSRSLFLAAGSVCLGVVGLLFSDFALQWQPVPPAIPGRTALAVLSALSLIVSGVLAAVPRAERIGAMALTAIFGIWIVLLHVPRVLAGPTSLVAWLGVAEISAIACGALMLWTVPQTKIATAARVGFGISALIFAASHFVYLDFTAAMVPDYLPAHRFWAVATGCGHAAAGVAILASFMPRAAAAAMAAMCGAFALLLHLPRVVASPASHAEWTMLCIAICIAGAAWAMRAAPSGGSRMTRSVTERTGPAEHA